MAGETIEALEIWLFDIGTGQADRLTQNRVQDALPQWWDGGQAVIFSRFGATGGVQVLRKPAQAVGQEEIIVDKMGFCWTASAMGKLLLCRARAKWGYVSFADAGHTFVPLPEPLQGIGGPEFSPDGKRLAYRSAESGPGEIYVADFPEFTKMRQVSRGGGFNPQWHPASSELFFVSSDGRSLMAARQKPGSSDFDAPAKVFDLPGSINPGGLGWPNCYCVSPDGSLFLMLQNEEDNATGAPAGKPNAMVIENWFEEFREKK
jgi:Tol biopolymer transport system component